MTNYVTISANYGMPVSKNFRKLSRIFTFTKDELALFGIWL